MGNNKEYLQSLMSDLSSLGINTDGFESSYDTSIKTNDFDLRIISEIEQSTGVKYSDEQRNILLHRGNMCILACAGSGKTTTSIHLIAKRLKTGEISDVSKMIYTTYSKAGAIEMKERLDKLLNQLGIKKNIQVRTLHSFFLSVLRTFGVTADIIKDKDRAKYIREACKDAEFNPKDDDLMLIDNLLSYQVNNLLSDRKTINSYVNTLEDLSVEQYSKIRTGYATRKAQAGVIDYDDMQSYLYLWLCKYAKSENENERVIAKGVRDYCRAMYTDFYIDEAQDVCKIQYAIIRAMITNPETPNKLEANLVFIGDDDQCLVEGTKVFVENGVTNIEDIQYNDNILSCVGHGKAKFMSVDNGSKKEYHGDIVKITTESGNEVKATPNHIGFVKIVPNENEFYTYLMYRHDFGFRIGTTSGVRAGVRRGLTNGIDMRLMQEKSDKIWIIKVCNNEHEAKYWEALLAYKYSIPMYRFVAGDSGKGIPNTSLSTDDIKKIHTELDTFNNGLRLLNDLGMDYKYPHRVPQAEGERNRILLSMLSSSQENRYGAHKSEISVNSSNKDYIEITSNYLATCERKSKTKYEYYNYRMTSDNIDLETSIVNKIIDDCKDSGIYVEPTYCAKLTEDKKFLFMPFCNIVKGMVVASYINGKIVEDKVINVEYEHYDGYVYDLSIMDTRNFIANGVVVHNCIYQWRGSDPSIILSVGPTFDMRTFVLSTNYRCHNEIVEYAAKGVEHNSSRYMKGMQAFNQGGNVKILPSSKEDLCSLSELALNHIKWWISQGDKITDIAVLARNNFHLAILSNMLLREGIYCNMTEDMKLTKSYMYKDIKSIIDFCEPNWKSENTASILWKLCRYMNIATARIIAEFQNNCSLSFSDTIGYIVKTFFNKELEFDKKLNINIQAFEKLKYHINRITRDTADDMELIYNATTSGKTIECLKVLLYQYLECTAYLYKSKDKQRSIRGLVNYMTNLVNKDGLEKTKEFLRVTEQFESGSMGVFGDKLTLSTIHSAKGREWKNVIMFACDNVSQPSVDGIYKLIDDGVSVSDIFENINEERRLCYVGNTRAKANLLIITYNMPSMFILEALGCFDKNTNHNDRILRLAQDSNEFDKYKQYVDEYINNKYSKYYYNKDNYKL